MNHHNQTPGAYNPHAQAPGSYPGHYNPNGYPPQNNPNYSNPNPGPPAVWIGQGKQAGTQKILANISIDLSKIDVNNPGFRLYDPSNGQNPQLAQAFEALKAAINNIKAIVEAPLQFDGGRRAGGVYLNANILWKREPRDNNIYTIKMDDFVPQSRSAPVNPHMQYNQPVNPHHPPAAYPQNPGYPPAVNTPGAVPGTLPPGYPPATTPPVAPGTQHSINFQQPVTPPNPPGAIPGTLPPGTPPANFPPPPQ